MVFIVVIVTKRNSIFTAGSQDFTELGINLIILSLITGFEIGLTQLAVMDFIIINSNIVAIIISLLKFDSVNPQTAVIMITVMPIFLFLSIR